MRVAVKCTAAAAGVEPVVGCDAADRRVWVKSSDHILFSSTFDAVLSGDAPASSVFDETAAAAVQHAISGGVGCVICAGTLNSGKAAMMHALPAWSIEPDGEGEVDATHVDATELAIAPRTLCEMYDGAATSQQDLTVSVAQLYFEMLMDLLGNAAMLPPASSVSEAEVKANGRTAHGASDTHAADAVDAAAAGALRGVSRHPVRSAVAGVRLLARAQRARGITCADPGTAHVLVELRLSGGGRLLLLEAARLDVLEPLDCTTANLSVRALVKLLTRPPPLPPSAEALLLPRFLRSAFDGAAVVRLLICVGHTSPSKEAASLRLAQQAKRLRKQKSADTKAHRQALVDHLQSKLQRLRARRPPSKAETEQGLLALLRDGPAIEASTRSMRELRLTLEAEVGEASGRRGGTRATAQAEAEADAREADALRKQLAQEKAEAERLLKAIAAVSARTRSAPASGGSAGSAEASGRRDSGVKERLSLQISQYEQAVHRAWEDVQRAQQQAEGLEEEGRRSRAHAQRSAAEHEEMETTLLEVAVDLEGLARSYRQNGSSAMAVPLYVSALAIFEKTLGSEHPQVASNLVNLGNAFCDQQKHAEAVPVYLRALAIDEKSLGREHPEVAMDLSNLATAHSALGNEDEAQVLFERAYMIMLNALGPSDPKTRAIARNRAESSRAKKSALSP